MTTHEDITVEETTAPAEIIEKAKVNLKPIAKKALIWGGAVVGVILGAVLLSKARQGDYEDDTIVIHEIPEGFAVVESDASTENVTDF